MPQDAYDFYRNRSGATLPTDFSVDGMSFTNAPYGSDGVQLTWKYENIDKNPVH